VAVRTDCGVTGGPIGGRMLKQSSHDGKVIFFLEFFRFLSRQNGVFPELTKARDRHRLTGDGVTPPPTDKCDGEPNLPALSCRKLL
jgi:hypothetical protein